MAMETPKLLGRAIPLWMLGNDLQQAGKRILWGGGAGLAAAAVNFIVIMATYFGDPAVAGVIQPGDLAFLWTLAEAGLLAALAAGTLKRSRPAAAALLSYQLVSKIALFGLALGGMGPGSLHPVYLILNLLIFPYLFFQGLRGALTWHYLTHPDYPTVAAAVKDGADGG